MSRAASVPRRRISCSHTEAAMNVIQDLAVFLLVDALVYVTILRPALRHLLGG